MSQCGYCNGEISEDLVLFCHTCHGKMASTSKIIRDEDLHGKMGIFWSSREATKLKYKTNCTGRRKVK